MVKFHMLMLVKDLGFAKIEIHPVLIESGQDLVLFDAGYPDQSGDFVEALAKLGFSIDDITKIVISHHDHDHVGSLFDLKKLNGRIEILAGNIEADIISGEKTSLRLLQAEEHNKTLTGAEKAFGEKFASYLKTIKPCKVDRVVTDGEYIATGVRVVTMPGHTPGHISLLIEDCNVFLAGDALAAEEGKLVLANPQFTMDKDEAMKSIKKLLNMSIDEVICYHGASVKFKTRKGLAELVSHFADSSH